MSDHRTMPTVTIGLAALACGGFRGGINRPGPKTSTGVVASPSLGRLMGEYIIQSESVYNGCGRITPHSVVQSAGVFG